jgi:hypothetical protein
MGFYKDHFGSWRAAIDAAGLPPRPFGGAGRWEAEATKSGRDSHDQRNRQMVTAGGHDVKKWEAVAA